MNHPSSARLAAFVACAACQLAPRDLLAQGAAIGVLLLLLVTVVIVPYLVTQLRKEARR